MLGLVQVFGPHDHDHPHAHVERAEHLVVGHVPALLDQPKEGRNFPRPAPDLRPEPLRKHARDVAGEAAARDVDERADLAAVEERLERREVAPV
jgi:hypothetical protein